MMKLGLTTNVFAGPLKNREIDLEGIIDFAAGLQIRSIEIRDDGATLNEDGVGSLVKRAGERGLSLSYAIKNDMLAAGDSELFGRAVRLASLCGPKTVLRMLASQDALKTDGKRGYSASDLEALKHAAQDYEKVAEASGVVMAIENARDPLYGGGGFFGMADLIASFGSRTIGLTFDPANATNISLCTSPSDEAEVLRFIDEVGTSIFLAHYKTTRRGVVQSTIDDPADVDNASLLSRLSKVYDGVLCVEIPGSPGLRETRASVEASLVYLRAKEGLF
jgi:sugar phosphate isomerase/epimerase